ncbi:MAG TPA: FAD/NAD(P)-binding protein [Luteimonas sp.]
MSGPVPSRVDVVVVGGGASGTLVAAHLLDGEQPALRVAVVEPRQGLGEGVAYGTRRPEHLLNVRAAGMSALDDQPGDFVRWLREQPEFAYEDPAALGTRFMPRRVYARYLEAVLAAQPGRARLQRITGTVVDVQPVDGGYGVELASGQRLEARAVVLAIGNRPARLPLWRDASGSMAVEAWDDPAVATIAPEADVCILGAGLSMVDVVLTLRANDHRGRIVSLSRRGLVPLPHAGPAPAAALDVPALFAQDLAGRTRTVRALASSEAAQGRPWQAAFDALRPHGQALWTSLDPRAQARFLRHLVRHWDVHRHRIAPEAAAQLDAATASGQLERLAGHLVAIEPGTRTTIAWRPRGRQDIQRFGADVLVNALGMDKRIDGGGDLLGRLCVRGLLRPGPHGMGAATAGEGTPLDAAGQPVPGLWTLGTLRIGDLWETIAMPELRGQARRVAGDVRAHLAAAAP